MSTKRLIIAIFCFIFVFTATTAFAALTLNTTSITSDGALTLTPTTNTIINGMVGIGTTTPGFQLDIGNGAFGDGRVQLNGSQPFLQIKDTDAGFAQTWTLQATQGRLRLINLNGTGAVPFSILPSGGVGMGVVLPLTKLTVGDSSATSPRGILSLQGSDDVNGARIGLTKTRGTLSVGGTLTPSTVASGDNLGRLAFNGYDGANYLEMGAIDVGVSGTVAATRVPTFMTFSTATDAAPSVLTERMRIDNTGNVGIGVTPPDNQFKMIIKGDSVNGNSPLSLRGNAGGDPATFNRFLAVSDEASTVEYFSISGSSNMITLGAQKSLEFRTTTNASDLLFSPGLIERMRIVASNGNVGIGTTSPNANALLDVSSTTKAFMPPRMTKVQRNAIASPTAGMQVYQTDNTPGLRVYNGTNWMRFTETAD